MKIKTIDVICKEWFDAVNGNSYFAGKVIVNYQMKTEKNFILIFQYGYFEHYKYMALELLEKKKIVKDREERESYWRYYKRKGIIARHTLHENCLKRELIQFIR